MVCDDVYIVAACRTGIGAHNGQFDNIFAYILGATVIKHCINKARISSEDISEVIMGQVLTAGYGQNPARQAAIAADIPMTTPAYTINMLGGSGLKALHLGYQAIRNGDAKFVVCGGQENMTMAQHSACIRNSSKIHGIEVLDTMVMDGLTEAFTGLHVEEIAEHFASGYSVTRNSQDDFAHRSIERAADATKKAHFMHEIVPVSQSNSLPDIKNDELVASGITIEKLYELQPIFEDNLLEGNITKGNASPNADGAAALIICNEVQVELFDLVPLARIVAVAQIAIEPMEVGFGLIRAIEKVLTKAGWSKSQVDLYEIDETFACQPVFVRDKLGLNIDKINVAGGSIALGTPLGANSARMLVTLLHNLHRLCLNTGVAAVSISGGMAIAVAVDRPTI